MTRTNLLFGLWLVASLVWLAFAFVALDIGGQLDRDIPTVALPERVDAAVETAREARREEAWLAIALWLLPPLAVPLLAAAYAAHRRRHLRKREIERRQAPIRENDPHL